MFPVIVPGWPGKELIVTDRVRAILDPQVLLAVTEIVPPLLPGVVVIELVVEVPVQPEGSVQV